MSVQFLAKRIQLRRTLLQLARKNADTLLEGLPLP